MGDVLKFATLGGRRVANGPTSSGPKPAQAWKYKPEPENYFEAQIMSEKKTKLIYFVLFIYLFHVEDVRKAQKTH